MKFFKKYLELPEMQNMMTYLCRSLQLQGLLSTNPYKGLRPWGFDPGAWTQPTRH